MALPFVSSIKRRNRELSPFLVGIIGGFFASSCMFFSIFSYKSLNQPDQESLSMPSFKLPNYPITNHLDDTGWKAIHVFYGRNDHMADVTTLPTPYFQANQWFSQFRQDEIISQLFKGKRDGFFIDLAANDAVRISNTYALETYFDWNGLCLEPNSIYWAGLAYRKCHVVAAVVGDETMGQVQFQFPKDKAPKGGIVGNEYDNKVVKIGETQHRYTVRLLDIFRRFQVPRVIDYLSLDVEGAEDLVMASFPFDEYQFLALTVERPTERLSKVLEDNGYIQLKYLRAKVETLWIHSLAKDTLDMDALQIDSDSYKYRENSDQERIAPERNHI